MIATVVITMAPTTRCLSLVSTLARVHSLMKVE
ncbi:MAG: hypothetical protein ACJAX5_003470 [Patiriisocius sp.]|jgi:hypothetical protein